MPNNLRKLIPLATNLVWILQDSDRDGRSERRSVQSARYNTLRRRTQMLEATKKGTITKPESAVQPTTFEAMSRLEQDLDRVFHEFWRRPFFSLWGPVRSWPSRMFPVQLPAVDVYEEKDEVVVKAELPGLSKEDLEVTLTESTLTLKGEKKN